MMRELLTGSILMLFACLAFAQSDEEIIEAIGDYIEEIMWDQMPMSLPQSFKDSGLAPSDKERILKQLARDGATCFTNSLVKFAELNDIPLSDFVSYTSEGDIEFEGVGGREFEHLWIPCITAARQAAGLPE